MNRAFSILLTFALLAGSVSCGGGKIDPEVPVVDPSVDPGTNPIKPDPTPQPNNSRVFYVSVASGSDTATPDQAKDASTPWKSIGKGIASIQAGDTLVVLGGTYRERITIDSRLSGTAEHPTLIVGGEGAAPVLDDEHDGKTDRWSSVIALKGVAHVHLKGLSVANGGWYGISTTDDCSDIVIEGCSTFNTRASGLYCTYVTGLLVTGNEVRKACQEHNRDSYGNGSQECITIARAKDFRVVDNEIWGSEVDGAAGGEGIDAKGASCDGEIAYNYIHDIVPLGIYVDAGSGESHNVLVHSNLLVDTGGLSVAGELGGTAKDIYFYNNVIVRARLSGITFQNIQNGKFVNVYVVNNTFVDTNKTGNFGGEIANYGKNTGNANIVVSNNIFYNAVGKQRFSVWMDYAAPCRISGNLYCMFKPGNSGGENTFNKDDLTSADVVDQDPCFVDVAGGDYHLLPVSPAIGKGVPVMLPDGSGLLFDTDADGKKRDASHWSLGAFE